MYTEFLTSEIYCIIARISCMLVYFDFELIPLMQTRFENYKYFYQIATEEDLPLIFEKLFEIEINLQQDIEYFLNESWTIPLDPPICYFSIYFYSRSYCEIYLFLLSYTLSLWTTNACNVPRQIFYPMSFAMLNFTDFKHYVEN